jgi:cell division protein YceG involved in septum cleavage
MIRLIKLIVWIVIILGGIFFWKYASYETTLITSEATVVEVKPGATFSSVLVNAGADSFFTKVYLRDNLPDFELQVGTYNIPENANVKVFLEAFENPINSIDISLTFLEGWNIFDIDQYLTRQELIDA